MKALGSVLLLCFSITNLSAQSWQWLSRSSSTAHSAPLDICIDPNGNSYVVISSKGSGNFQSTTLSKGINLVKLDAAGQAIWSRNLSFTPSSIAADGSENIYLVQNYFERVQTPSQNFVSKGHYDF